MKKSIASILIVVLMLTIVLVGMFSFTACGEVDDNKIYVGLECDYVPFNFPQKTDANGAVEISNFNGYANGYDVMIAKKIAESLGKELVIVKYDWNALISGVTTGALDFIIAGMSPTEERLKSIDFSDAYYSSNLVIVVRKDGAYANATSLADFKGAKLVAQKGTFHDVALERQANEIGYTRQNAMDDFPIMKVALDANAIDGYVAEEPGAFTDCMENSDFMYIPLKNNTTGFIATEKDTQIAIGMKKGSEYKDAINAALAQISQAEREQMMENAKKWATQNN